MLPPIPMPMSSSAKKVAIATAICCGSILRTKIACTAGIKEPYPSPVITADPKKMTALSAAPSIPIPSAKQIKIPSLTPFTAVCHRFQSRYLYQPAYQQDNNRQYRKHKKDFSIATCLPLTPRCQRHIWLSYATARRKTVEQQPFYAFCAIIFNLTTN